MIPTVRPLLRGGQLPWFWARQDYKSTTWVFLAHPKARDLKYPTTYGHSYSHSCEVLEVEVDTMKGDYKQMKLVFEPYQSLLLKIEKDGTISFCDLGYTPPRATIMPPHHTCAGDFS